MTQRAGVKKGLIHMSHWKLLGVASSFFFLALICGCGDDSSDDSAANDNGETANDDSESGSDRTSHQDTGSAVESDSDSSFPALPDLASLQNRVFVLAIAPGNWTKPAGVGSEIGTYVPSFAFEVESVDGNELDVLLGTVDGEEQDPCGKTHAIEGSVEQNPHFDLGPVDFETVVTGPEKSVIATIYGLGIEGDFTENGGKIRYGRFTGVIDIREIYELFNKLPNPTAELICQTAPTLGFQCEACPTDDESFCITVVAENLSINEVSSLSLDQVVEIEAVCVE